MGEMYGKYAMDWKRKQVCAEPFCGAPLSSSVSKASGYCTKHDVGASRNERGRK